MDKDTAFRWRHRLLTGLDESDVRPLGHTVTLGETWFPFSEKGKRGLDRPPRRRAAYYRADIAPVWVFVARDGNGRPASGVVGPRMPTAEDLATALASRLGRTKEISSTRGLYAAHARLASLLDTPHRRVTLVSPEADALRRYTLALRRWLKRFHGVATRYLANYLAWHRLLTVIRVGGVERAGEALLAARFP